MKIFKLFRIFRYVRKFGFRRSMTALRHLPAYLRFYVRLFADSRVPAWPKLFAVGVLVYIVSPLDFVPDFIPFFGELDDIALVLMAVNRLLSAAPHHVRQEHEAAANLPNRALA